MKTYLAKSLALLFMPRELVKVLFAYAVFVFLAALTAFDPQHMRMNAIIMSGLHVNFILVPMFIFFVCSRSAALIGLYSRIRVNSRRRAFLIRAASGAVETLLFILPYLILLLIFVRAEVQSAASFALGLVALILLFYIIALCCISLDVVFDKPFLGFITIIPLTVDCFLAMESISGVDVSLLYLPAYGFFANDPEFNIALAFAKLAGILLLVFAAGYIAASRRE